MPEKLSDEVHARRLAHYQRGLIDKEIAELEGLNARAIFHWRKRNSLSTNFIRKFPAGDREFLALYNSGLGDRQIGRRAGFAEATVSKWRKRRGLPTHHPEKAHLTVEMRAARMLLYSFGYSDGRIAKEQGVGPTAVARWRKVLRLPVNNVPRVSRSRRQDEPQKLLARIRRAMPSYMSPADRDDAASDLYLAVMSGAIPVEEIERRAKSVGNKVLKTFADKWGARSLDEEIGDDGDGFRMIDLIRDDRSSSWLEEMGATVW